jgi:AhpD family alkylhydroperoxidase
MSRVELPGDDTTNPELIPVFTHIRESVGGIPNLYRALANAPALLEAWIGFAWSLRADAGVSRALRELAILRVAHLNRADYVWRSHWRLALAAGVREYQLAELSGWSTSDRFSDAERSVLQMTDELTGSARISDASWTALRRSFDEQEAVELVLTVSFYSCAARLTNGLEVPIEADNLRWPAVPPGSSQHS